MNVEELHFFIETANLKSMRLAAEKLYVTPQYVSKSIQNLEGKLNVKLFRRGRYGVELTKEGEFVYPIAKEIYDQMIYLYEVVPKIISDDKALPTEEPQLYINIGTSGSYANSIIDVLGVLSSKYSNISPNIVSREANDLLHNLDEKDYDIVLCNAPQKFVDSFSDILKNYLLYPVAQTELFLFANKFSPLSLKEYIMVDELDNLPLSFVCSNTNVTPLFLEILQEKNIIPCISFTSSSTQSINAYAYRNNTYTIGSSWLKSMYKKNQMDVVAIPIHGLDPIWQIFLIRKDTEAMQLAEDLRVMIEKVF